MSKKRIVLFGSYYRGYFILSNLLYGRLRDCIKIVGLVTDDPTQSYVSPGKRVWKYGFSESEGNMVSNLAKEHGIPVYNGRIKTEEFYKIYEAWNPDICVMGTFGQLVNKRIFDLPEFGFYNFHPSTKIWPSCVGGDPFEQMIKKKDPCCVITMHHVNEFFDDGKKVAHSSIIPLPENASVTDLHKMTSPVAGNFAVDQIEKILF